MTHMQRKSGPRSSRVLGNMARAGGLVVASSLISGAALAKDDKTETTNKKVTTKAAGNSGESTMAVKTAPVPLAVKTITPNSTVAVKQAPNSASLKKATAEK